MDSDEVPIGELVSIVRGEYAGYAGVVSWAITQKSPGFVLISIGDSIAGVKAEYPDIRLADRTGDGFTQLSYKLLKLSSCVIEKSLLPLTRGR